MKTKLKQMMLAVVAFLIAVANASGQVLSAKYSFDNTVMRSANDGSLLLLGNTLYGAAFGKPYGGGRGGSMSGSLFKLNINGTGFTNLYTFSPVVEYSLGVYTNTDGANSAGQLVLSGNRLYGTTYAGGFYAYGTVFAVNTDGTDFTNLYNFSAPVFTTFSSNTDGATPSAGLVLSGNTLYGTTSTGGNLGGGTVFAINTDGTGFTNLYNFSEDYGNVRVVGGKSGLILSSNILYGTTYLGGSSTNGTVFAINTDGTGFTNLHSFSSLVRETISEYVYFDTNSDGAYPQAPLVLSGNKLYGTATGGGSGIYSGSSAFGGTVFAVNTDGTGFTNLHSFNGNDGANPTAGLVLSGRTLYGTAQLGGSLTSQLNGAVFAINTDGAGFATLNTFTITQPNSSGHYTNADGAVPVGNLILSGTTLYGATVNGGANGFGTVFALDLAVMPPTVQFTASPTNGIVRLKVQFNCPAADTGGNPILSWNWNFGDGSNSVSTSQNPAHTYTNVATFLPTLTCINNNGDTVICSGPAIVTQPLPPIQFTASPTNGVPPPMAVKFSSPGVDGGSNMIVSWNWNFGDSSNIVSAGQNPSHTYTNTGAYYPTLICSNYFGDRSVVSGPAIAVPNSLLLNSGFEAGTFTNWTLGGGTSYNRVTTGTTYAHSGKYGAELGARLVDGAGFLSQTLSTTPGADYLISFWLDVSLALATNDFQVTWNGDVLLDETNVGSTGWTNFQLMATATLTNSTLKFGYLAGSLYSLDDVIVTLGGGSAPKQPQIATFSVSGPNLILSGGGAWPGKNLLVLMSTNLLQPLSQWTAVATNAPDSSGNFNLTATNAVDPKASQRYYILELQ
jgi:uncharacterized repeat protein (TIGR03803 family)